MKIIVTKGKGGWRWAFVAKNGKQTANNETHPTRSNAIRAAKGVVTAVVRGLVPRPTVVWQIEDTDAGVVLTYTSGGVK